MKHTLLVVILLSVALLYHPRPTTAQEGHGHGQGHEHSEKLGSVSFKISCNAKAQKQFNRAVAWLHSFEYEEAEKAFTEASVTDPRCGMAYWGIAISNYHPLWAPPVAEELTRGFERHRKGKGHRRKHSARTRLHRGD